MTIIQFPNHSHSDSTKEKCLHCAVLDLVEREFPKITAIEFAQKLVEILADVIKAGADPGFHEEALREVQTDLEHVLLQKMTFTSRLPS
jgi:hypothetical protein